MGTPRDRALFRAGWLEPAGFTLLLLLFFRLFARQMGVVSLLMTF